MKSSLKYCPCCADLLIKSPLTTLTKQSAYYCISNSCQFPLNSKFTVSYFDDYIIHSCIILFIKNKYYSLSFDFVLKDTELGIFNPYYINNLIEVIPYYIDNVNNYSIEYRWESILVINSIIECDIFSLKDSEKVANRLLNLKIFK